MSEEARVRGQIVAAAQAMSREGLSPGRSGNVSARWEDGFLITPTGVAYEGLTPAQIVFVGLDGATRTGELRPSSEWQLHRAIYAAHADAGAIVHAHSLNATALACAGKAIPAFHYMVAVAGGRDIPLAPYAMFGTEELAKLAAAALEGRRACLLANHGQVAFGRDVSAALELAREVETLAAQYMATLQIGGPQLLSDAEMDEVLARFKSYGQQSDPGDA